MLLRLPAARCRRALPGGLKRRGEPVKAFFRGGAAARGRAHSPVYVSASIIPHLFPKKKPCLLILLQSFQDTRSRASSSVKHSGWLRL